MSKPKLTQARLKELLHYDPETGVFTWRVRNSNRCPAGTVAGCKAPNGYINFSIDYGKYRGHRLAFLYMTGRWPTPTCDHKNRIRHDNRWCNLREANYVTQNTNKPMRADNSSGTTGVYWSKKMDKWLASIGTDGKLVNLGFFDTLEAAIFMRAMGEILYR